MSKHCPVPRTCDSRHVARDEFRFARAPKPEALPKPTKPASAGAEKANGNTVEAAYRTAPQNAPANKSAQSTDKERLFANPGRPANHQAAQDNGQLLDKAGVEVFRVYFSKVLRLSPSQVTLKQLRKGSRVIGGTVLGRVAQLTSGPGSNLAPHLNFSIRPAGRGAPRIDPKPVLDGWKLLEATAIYRAAGRNPFVNQSAVTAG